MFRDCGWSGAMRSTWSAWEGVCSQCQVWAGLPTRHGLQVQGQAAPAWKPLLFKNERDQVGARGDRAHPLTLGTPAASPDYIIEMLLQQKRSRSHDQKSPPHTHTCCHDASATSTACVISTKPRSPTGVGARAPPAGRDIVKNACVIPHMIPTPASSVTGLMPPTTRWWHARCSRVEHINAAHRGSNLRRHLPVNTSSVQTLRWKETGRALARSCRAQEQSAALFSGNFTAAPTYDLWRHERHQLVRDRGGDHGGSQHAPTLPQALRVEEGVGRKEGDEGAQQGRKGGGGRPTHSHRHCAWSGHVGGKGGVGQLAKVCAAADLWGCAGTHPQ